MISNAKEIDGHVCKMMELLSLKNVLMTIGNLIKFILSTT